MVAFRSDKEEGRKIDDEAVEVLGVTVVVNWIGRVWVEKTKPTTQWQAYKCSP